MYKRNLTTEEIERRFDLHDRYIAVKTLVHAENYLLREYGGLPDVENVNACELLADGIKNAVDGRATGDEWRTVRHTYNNERDGVNPPEGKDRRCQRCGAVDPEPFSHCYAHRRTASQSELYGLPSGGHITGPLSEREKAIFDSYRESWTAMNSALARWRMTLPEELHDSLQVLCGSFSGGCFCGDHISDLMPAPIGSEGFSEERK